ncbi:Hypothetical predicted protein [Mytilus galloprovincialis]|uniref:CCHC-type domain-containing protein n=1 Tax=Mytilus galloprovincialis TaxID=29158 RepID=A0A8B6CIB4_MYTGA|nr:Hypothetical predicted protein [Mytilus galloprovincialis]
MTSRNGKKHLVRARNQEEARRNLTDKMNEKRGINWHISVSLMKKGITFESITHVHIFENPTSQDADVTSQIMVDVVTDLVKGLPTLNKFHLFSDNAGCYKSSTTLTQLHSGLGNLLDTYNFSEAQNGKGSLRRGLIKDTNIETGTRYVQLTNCIPIIPTATKFGRFSVSMFADNNKTECPYCTRTDHPSYRCTNKPSRQNQAARKCYRCNSTTHTIKDCPHSEKLCYRCGKEGHIQRDCQTDDQEMYGDYVHDIQEGRDANKNDSFTEDNNSEELIVELNKTTETVFEQTNATLPTSETVIFGASNCSRIRIEDPSINNIAVSGTTLDQIDKLVCQSDNIVNSDYIANVILSLGTNDISKHRSDTEQITANLTTCIDTLKTKYPNARIGICSILPRRGKGSSIQALNTAARSVNSFTQKLCVKSQVLKYIDLWDEFAPNKTPFRALFDLNDPSGVHISKSGIELMENIFEDFINSKCEGEYETPSKKRNRSSSSTPGSSEKQVTKMPKSC